MRVSFFIDLFRLSNFFKVSLLILYSLFGREFSWNFIAFQFIHNFNFFIQISSEFFLNLFISNFS
jgi:hypothetical protein